MAEYDQINGRGEMSEDEDDSYNGQNYNEVCAAFQQNCRLCQPEQALRFALEAYFNGGVQRVDIINRLFTITVEDKGLANTSLFLIVFQLLVPLLTRAEDESSFLEEKSLEEEWKTVKDFPDINVSELGKFKSGSTGKFLIVVKKEVYNYIMIDGSFYRTDMLVAKSFLDKRGKGLHFIEHIDGDRSDDSYENLRWVSEEPGYTTGKKPPPVPFEFIKPIDYNNLNENPDRLSYIYRFAIAVWITASSPSSKLNSWATLLFREIEQDMETEEDYIKNNGSSDDCKSLLLEALLEKNLYLCLYYAKVLHCHPQAITQVIKWTKEKKAYVYIWEAFTQAAIKAPNHVQGYYLRRMRSLGVSEGWRNTDNSRILYAHYIHMWCMDPITAYSTIKGEMRDYTWNGLQFKGAFTNDFRKPGVDKKIRGKWSKKYQGDRISGKWHSATSVEEDEPLLFPINPDILEPSSQDKMRYIDYETGKRTRFPNFNTIFKSVLEGETTQIPRGSLSKNILDNPTLDERIAHTIITRTKLEKEDKKWLPLTVFYAHLSFYDGSPDILEALNKVYGDMDEFYKEYDYPNPFDEEKYLPKKNAKHPDESDFLDETEFISFKGLLKRTLGIEETKKDTFSSTDPAQRRHMRSKSTFVYRTVPSPLKRAVPTIEVTINARISPLKMEKKSSVSTPGTGKRVPGRITIKDPPLPSPHIVSTNSEELPTKSGRKSSKKKEESSSPKVHKKK